MPIADVSGMPVARISPGTIRNPPPIPKNPERIPPPQTDAQQQREKLAGRFCRWAHSRVARSVPLGQHCDAHGHHHKPDQDQELLAVEGLGKLCTQKSPKHVSRREHGRAAPFDIPGVGVREQVAESTRRHRKCARSHGDVRRAYPDEIDEQRDRKYRASAPHQPEHKPDDRAGAGGEEAYRCVRHQSSALRFAPEGRLRPVRRTEPEQHHAREHGPDEDEDLPQPESYASIWVTTV